MLITYIELDAGIPLLVAGPAFIISVNWKFTLHPTGVVVVRRLLAFAEPRATLIFPVVGPVYTAKPPILHLENSSVRPVKFLSSAEKRRPAEPVVVFREPTWKKLIPRDELIRDVLKAVQPVLAVIGFAPIRPDINDLNEGIKDNVCLLEPVEVVQVFEENTGNVAPVPTVTFRPDWPRRDLSANAITFEPLRRIKLVSEASSHVFRPKRILFGAGIDSAEVINVLTDHFVIR